MVSEVIQSYYNPVLNRFYSNHAVSMYPAIPLIIAEVRKIKLLFVCSRNRWRSLTAEKIFHEVNGHQVRSAGTEQNARIKVTSGHIGWADLIFVMEKKHTRRLREKFGPLLNGSREVICLDIPDEYTFMDEELIETLRSRVSDYIEIS